MNSQSQKHLLRPEGVGLFTAKFTPREGAARHSCPAGMASVLFSAEDGGIFTSSTELDEREVFAAFRQSFVKSTELTNASKMLFKITVDEGTKTKSVCWLGVPHVTTFAVVLDLLNKKFSGNGAFLLKGGYGIRPQQSAGQIFMKYGYEIEFHPKVDLTRIAWHQRG